MILNKSNLHALGHHKITIPQAAIFDLPEKVLQFGTGVLLRGLPDFFIDKANREGKFNGRIVVVKSTDTGSSKEFDHQDALYTICIRGIENGKSIEENIVSSAISRVLTAGKQWDDILAVAASPDLEIVLSNTTEVGIQLIEDDVHAQPPVSFPGKLLALLLHRYQQFNGAKDKGLVIVPTELIVDNATKLEDILVKLAKRNNLSFAFIEWMQHQNHFCNSLVDCIVPGKPDADTTQNLQANFGYQDDLLIMSEVYRLWAIQGGEQVKEKLSFAAADNGVVITPDIDLHRELKLRLLNGTHTLSCGIAHLAGFETVKAAMDAPFMETYIAGLMQSEIAPAIPYKVSKAQTEAFAFKVLDRFRNPNINHQWLSITANFTSKLKMRVVPVLLQYVKLFKAVPDLMALGFAAYIRFMKPDAQEGTNFYGSFAGKKYLINDTKAAHLAALWKKHPKEEIAQIILSDTILWGQSLAAIPGFTKAVNQYLKEIENSAALVALITKASAKTEA